MSYFYENNSNSSVDEAQFSTRTSPFFTDQVFGSREDMMNWVKNTAYSLGYVIVTQRSKKCKNGLMTIEFQDDYFNYIPKNFHPHIIEFQDVRGDGNCGFRSVALGLSLSEGQWPQVRSDLVQELMAHEQWYKCMFGTSGFDNIYKTVETPGEWMLMPNTGLVIASAYNRVVISLAAGGSVGASTISFPLWSSPSQSQPHEHIVIAHVHGNHYIRVILREGCPLPLTHPLWAPYRSDIASCWEYPYLSRQDEFRRYHYRVPQAYDLS